ncbi:Fe-S oxidoreductase [Candidatus Scalindua japonica]|uniref:Fe-S oxidoreductase n=1 Tax=Candidatus Scalindua japonica TaxID=1284222 RepID=A0A286TTJ8_9BACT|nr:SPASM domain-containing protein [Candidatus Scalindua japonica]GAX59185.1 Fe-S oxidoreductase [Candidatus Scalindua japonica]
MNVNCLIFLHLIFVKEDELNRQIAVFRELFQTESIHWAGYRYKPDGIDVEILVKKIEEIKSRKYKMPIVIHPDFTREEIIRYYREPVFLSKSYSNTCIAPWTSVYVLPNGDISPCSSFVAGNIKNESFKKIWNNQKFRHFRTELREKKYFPVCHRCCEFYKH